MQVLFFFTMLSLSEIAHFSIGLYCFTKIGFALIDSKLESKRLERSLRAAEKEEKEKEEEEEVRRIGRSRREKE